jgi:hypothetical protein
MSKREWFLIAVIWLLALVALAALFLASGGADRL